VQVKAGGREGYSCTMKLYTVMSSASASASSAFKALVVRVLVALCLGDGLVGATGVEHIALLFDGAGLFVDLCAAVAKGTRLELALDRDGAVAAETLAHVNHALFAFGIALLELLTLRGQRILERRAQTVAGLVALDHDAVAILQAKRQRGACGGLVRLGVCSRRGWSSVRMSLHDCGMVAVRVAGPGETWGRHGRRQHSSHVTCRMSRVGQMLGAAAAESHVSALRCPYDDAWTQTDGQRER
jgi:hypothetical protein